MTFSHIPALVQTLTSKGFVLIKGKELCVEQFDALTSQLSDQVLIHGSDRVGINEDDSIQEVTKGTDYVPPHMEMGRMPEQPDIASFYCKSPAELGGETIIVDGKAVFEALSAATRDYFLYNPIKFTAIMDMTYWKRSWGCHSISDVKELIYSKFNEPCLEFKFLDEDMVSASFITSAIKKTTKGECYFTNSIFGPYSGDGGGILTKADGDMIPEEILEEIQVLYKEKSVIIELSAGDLVLLDNRRFMHGRMPFEGGSRQMYAKFFNLSVIGALYEN